MTAGDRKKTPEITGEDDIKTSSMNKFRETFIEKLTTKDLDEFQFFLKKQYGKESGWNNEYKLKFESKLRQYFHEEVMKREIASIETLLGLLDRRDLKK
jgi:DNA-binding MurR/RpiR family transcriptional regulator